MTVFNFRFMRFKKIWLFLTFAFLSDKKLRVFNIRCHVHKKIDSF
jgi:hypothetical protein